MMHTDWKNELDTKSAHLLNDGCQIAHILPPNSLICIVTTASPIQTKAKTPENTLIFCSPDLVIDNKELRRRQKISGPLSLLRQSACHSVDTRHLP